MQHEYELREKASETEENISVVAIFSWRMNCLQMSLSALSENNEICSSQGGMTHAVETPMRSIGGPRDQFNNLHWDISLQSTCPHRNSELALEGLLGKRVGWFQQVPRGR